MFPSGIVVSNADCCAVGIGFGSRRRNGCLQMYSVFAAWGTLKSHRATSPLVRLVEVDEMWEAPDHLRVIALKIGVKPS
ncbi:hypothetical protein TNCV_4700821 [Trichonephila clavipes]|nr:hypothetical protein TNCV_4700821 [Trichonephila clavipes]